MAKHFAVHDNEMWDTIRAEDGEELGDSDLREESTAGEPVNDIQQRKPGENFIYMEGFAEGQPPPSHGLDIETLQPTTPDPSIS